MNLKYEGQELNLPLRCGKLDYIVTGTGRCGTVFLAKLLSSVGINCGHETIFQPDDVEYAMLRVQNSTELPALNVSFCAKITSAELDEQKGVSWFKNGLEIQADSSYMAAPFLDRFKDADVIHVVREPLSVINSFLVGLSYFVPKALEDDTYLPGVPSRKDFHEFIYSHVPELRDLTLSPVERAALYYIRWNRRIEGKGKRYFRQQIENGDFQPLFEFLGVAPDQYYDNKEINKRDYRKKYDYNSIDNPMIKMELLEIARDYGYIG